MTYRVWIAVPLTTLNVSRVEALGVALFVEGLPGDDRRAICELSVPVDVLAQLRPDLAERIEDERRNFQGLWTTNGLIATHVIGDFVATVDVLQRLDLVLSVVPAGTCYVVVDLDRMVLSGTNIEAFADMLDQVVDPRRLLALFASPCATA